MAMIVHSLTTNDNFRVYSRSYREDDLYSAQPEFEGVYEVCFRGMLYSETHTIYGEKTALHLAHNYIIKQTGKRFTITSLPIHRYGRAARYTGRFIHESKVCAIDKAHLPEGGKGPRFHVAEVEVDGKIRYKTGVSSKVPKETTCDEITAMLDLGVLVWKLQEYEKQSKDVKLGKEKAWNKMREVEEEEERLETLRIEKKRLGTRSLLREKVQDDRARGLEEIENMEHRRERLGRLVEEKQSRLGLERFGLAEDRARKTEAESGVCQKVVEIEADVDEEQSKEGEKEVVRTENVPDTVVRQLDKTDDEWTIVDDSLNGDGADVDGWNWIGDL
ncbi:hypothetical protein B7494_g3894 [Chlorociboria aeruginascens]|nr:hypothetical protein B7494_g3894 [Chlorociboria aeruginascens]